MDAFKDNSYQILNQAKDFLNKPLTLEATSGVFTELNRELSFEGIVTNVHLDRSQRGAKVITVTAYGPTVHLSGIPTTRSFHDMSLDDIVQEVIQNIPGNVSSNVATSISENIEYTVQYNETNMEFLQRLANTYGQWFYYDGAELVFGKLPGSAPIDLPINRDLLEFSLALKVVPISYQAKSYDYLKHEIYASTTRTTDVTDLDQFGSDIISDFESPIFGDDSLEMPAPYFSSERELDDHVLNDMACRSREMVVFNGVSDHVQLKVGSIINITGESKNEVDLNKYIITSITHQIDENLTYLNYIKGIPAEGVGPPCQSVHLTPKCDMQTATVVENDDDKAMGRVKVRFKWQEQSQMTPWIRILNQSAGQENALHGFFFVPEVDDEVIVGFENNNPNRPIVIGSVYRHHDDNHPQTWYERGNNRKVIKTRSGNQIHFVDESDKEEIFITNKDIENPTNEIRLSMEGDGKITIKTLGELDIKAKSIKMESDTDLDIKTKGNTNIDINGSLKISSQSDTEMKSQNMKIDSGPGLEISAMDTKIDATSVSIKGSGQLELEGATAKLKGTGTLNLESSGMTSLKGSLVNIN
jgi:uncharacterized protein involved in type VI secretion and phage assembly